MWQILYKNRFLLLLFSLVTILLSGIFFTNHFFDVSFQYMTADVTAIGGLKPLAGILSSIGILMWIVAAVICLFVSQHIPNDRKCFFLVSWGFFTAYLGFDDLFLLHEWILPSLTNLDENVIITFYIMIAAGLFYKFKSDIKQSDWTFFIAAIFFFALSILIDLVGNETPSQFFYEDGAKFIGITCWMVYFVKVSSKYLSDKDEKESRCIL